MPIEIPQVQGVSGTGYVQMPDLEATTPTTGTDGSAFAQVLGGVVDNAQQLQGASKDLTVKALTGDLTDIHDATLASTRAQVTLELTAAVRNKAVDAFNEIMRMQA